MHMTQRSYQLRNMVAKPEGYNVNHCGAIGTRAALSRGALRSNAYLSPHAVWRERQLQQRVVARAGS